MARNTGETTRQLTACQRGAVYVWCNDALHYPRQLANSLNRRDIKIVAPDYLNLQRWRGVRLTEIVVDHATSLTEEQATCLRYLQHDIATRGHHDAARILNKITDKSP